MAKYNLMDTEKPEYFDRYFDEEDDKKETPKPETEKKEEQTLPDIDEREYFDESLFTEESAPDHPATPDALENIQEETPPKEPIVEDPLTPKPPQPKIEENELPKPPPAPKPELSEYDYEDSKIQGINWKPLLIWSTVFIVVIVIIFFLYTWFFADSTPGQTSLDQKPVISPQEQMRLDLEKKKLAFISNIVTDKQTKLTNFSNLSDLKTKGVTYSSILLYDNSFNFEVFGKTREDIARYNQNLKRNKFDDNFKILSVNNRPGSNGGVFALYSASISPSGKAGGQSNPTIDANIQTTIQNLIKSNGLTLKNERIVNRKKVDQFEMIRKELTISGSEANCVKFLDGLNTTNRNFSVHKISMIKSNQKNIASSHYNLLIIFDFYD
jgi:hypothetical protein